MLTRARVTVSHTASASASAATVSSTTASSPSPSTSTAAFVTPVMAPRNYSVGEFDVSQRESLASDWAAWTIRLESIFHLSRITEQVDKLAILRVEGGIALQTLLQTKFARVSTYDEAKTELTKHFTPVKNKAAHILAFRSIVQHDGENFDSFLARLESAGRKNASELLSSYH